MRTIRTSTIHLLLLGALLAPAPPAALGPEQTAVIVNTADPPWRSRDTRAARPCSEAYWKSGAV